MSQAITFRDLRFYLTNSSFLNGQHKRNHLLSISLYLINCLEFASHHRLYLTLHVNNKQRRTLIKWSCLYLVCEWLSWNLTASLRQGRQGDRRWNSRCWTVFKTFTVHTAPSKGKTLDLYLRYVQLFMQGTAINQVCFMCRWWGVLSEDGYVIDLEEHLTKMNWSQPCLQQKPCY